MIYLGAVKSEKLLHDYYMTQISTINVGRSLPVTLYSDGGRRQKVRKVLRVSILGLR